MRVFTAIIAVSLMSSLSTFGKACFFTQTELVENAAVIAVVRLDEPEDAQPVGGKNVDPFAGKEAIGKFWNYSQQAKVHVEKVLKGKVPSDFTMYGQESFVCAQCRLTKGRFLAFLSKDGDLWAGANWQLSLRPIRDKEVEWYVSENQLYPMQFRKLEEVVERIKTLLKRQESEKGAALRR